VSFGKFFCERGCPALPTRRLVGLHMIKHMEGLSDEAVCAAWTQDPYHQYFCGRPFFEYKLALDRSSMSRWRGRAGPEQRETLLAETLRIALATNATTTEAFERVTVDTTVQTKAIAHPSDAHLLLRSIQTLSRMAKAKGIKLRQSFVFVAKAARMTGVTALRAYVDLGYRGHNYKGKADVFLPRDRTVTSPAIKRERKRRSAIEPVIGHLKSDGMLERNRLKGADGDAINAILCAIGHNMRLLAAWLKLLWRALFISMENPAQISLAAA
jgi:Transposase domain (DUF772)